MLRLLHTNMGDEAEKDTQPSFSGAVSSICGKKKHKYDVDFKLKAIEYAEQFSGEKAAKEFGVDSRRIREWKQQKADLLILHIANDRKRCRLEGGGRKKSSKYLDATVVNWIQEMRQSGLRMSRRRIRSKASQMNLVINGPGEMSNGKTKIVIDCDPGADDAQAILMALNASHVEIVAITTVFGNSKVENTAKNALRLVTYCHRSDIQVYKGCDSSLLMELPEGDAYFGNDGFGDIDIPEVDPVNFNLISAEHASQALCRLVSANPDAIILVALGPLTNIATCLKLDSDFGRKLKDCIIMGGNYQGRGNMSPTAEHNFWKDPEAAHAVLNGLQRKATVIPYETCLQYATSWDWYEKYASGETKLSVLMRDIDQNAVAYMKARETPDYHIYDQLAMAVVLEPTTAEEVTELYANVELHGTLTRGQMVIDWQNKLNRPANIRLVMSLNDQNCKDMMMQSIKMF